MGEAAYCFSKAIFTSPPINVPIHVCTQRNVHIDNQVLFNLSMGFEVKLGTPPIPRPTEDPSITTTASKYACPEMDVDFGGSDITVIVDVLNWEECAATCLDMPDCLFWTLDNREGQHRCIPKTSDAGYHQYENHISGVRGCPMNTL